MELTEHRVRELIRDELVAVREDIKNNKQLIVEDRQLLVNHNTDRFAHGWDHHLLIQDKEKDEEWNRWRQSMDRWRWTIAGALGLVSIEIPIATGIIVSFVVK